MLHYERWGNLGWDVIATADEPALPSPPLSSFRLLAAIAMGMIKGQAASPGNLLWLPVPPGQHAAELEFDIGDGEGRKPRFILTMIVQTVAVYKVSFICITAINLPHNYVR